jgi:hypothetical protein
MTDQERTHLQALLAKYPLREFLGEVAAIAFQNANAIVNAEKETNSGKRIQALVDQDRAQRLKTFVATP